VKKDDVMLIIISGALVVLALVGFYLIAQTLV